MHTLVSFYSSIANGVTNTGVAGAIDQSMTQDVGGRVQAPGPWRLLAAHAVVPNGTAARVNAPSWRSPLLPQIYPITVGTAIASLDGPTLLGQRGPRFVTAEGFQPEISRGGAGAGDCFAAVWIAPDITPAPVGPAFTLLATSAITTVKGQWVLGTLTLDQALPSGRYAVAGMAVVCTGGLYARLVYPGGATFRPGVTCQGTYGDKPLVPEFRYGGLWHFGEFQHNAQPSIEVFASAAAAVTASVYLDLIKIQ